MKECIPEVCTIFTTALCNLNCKYCYICKDKAGGLQAIDKDLEEDFKNNQYIKQILDYDERLATNINHFSLWGGEPFLHIERFTDHIQDYFINFPNFQKIDTSTNFTIPEQVKLIEHLLHEIDRYYNKEEKFTFELQLSIDGYKEMNDFSRGVGVSEKFLENWKNLLLIDYNADRINFRIHIKPTLAKDTFCYLDTPEKCYKWFEWLSENLYQPYINIKPKFEFNLALFNCASPTDWTKEDGLMLAQILRNIKKITPKAKKLPGWSNGSLNFIARFAERAIDHCKPCSVKNIGKNYSMPCGGGTCGVFTGLIVPIPHGKYTMCHKGLFDSYVDYCNNVESKEEMNGLSKRFIQYNNVSDFIYTKEELHKINQTMTQYFSPNRIAYTDYITIIREYAFAGLIDEKYKNIDNIEPTLCYFFENSYCVQDAYIMTGSWITRSTLEIPLLYNGAMDLMIEEAEEFIKERGYML